MIGLRVLAPEDWPVWRALRLAALADAPYAFHSRLADWQGPGDRAERWRARLARPGSFDLMALVDGVPAGMAGGLAGERRGAVELVSVWVGPTGRGRGVADRLIHAVEAWAVRMRAESLELAVMPGNVHAIALYRRNGFADTGVPGDPTPDGGRERLMSKPLPSSPAARQGGPAPAAGQSGGYGRR